MTITPRPSTATTTPRPTAPDPAAELRAEARRHLERARVGATRFGEDDPAVQLARNLAGTCLDSAERLSRKADASGR